MDVWNVPLPKVRRTLRVPLCDSGLIQKTTMRSQNCAIQRMTLDRDCQVELPVRVAAQGVSWYLIE